MSAAVLSVVHVRTKRHVQPLGGRWVGAYWTHTKPRRFACDKAQPNFIHDNLSSHIELGVRTGCIVPLYVWRGLVMHERTRWRLVEMRRRLLFKAWNCHEEPNTCILWILTTELST